MVKAKKADPAGPIVSKVAHHKAAAKKIQCWATDPRDALQLRWVSAPTLPGEVLGIKISSAVSPPVPFGYDTGTAEFRYWVAAEALRRAADFWKSVGCTEWEASIGKTLAANLDAGQDYNAFYAREDYPQLKAKAGLSFYRFTVADAAHAGRVQTVYFGESPDILAHELGHAVLDALQPHLYGTNTAEYSAFHEGFADVSSILTALQLQEVREAVIAETQGQLWLNSSVARLAEEVGSALRQVIPQVADPDCLRNLSTTWVYRDPTELSGIGSNAVLTSEPHNFSRVFSGAFLNALGHMAVAIAGDGLVTPAHLLEASFDSGRLLVEAVRKAPLRTRLFQAVAEQLIIAADRHPAHGPVYVKAITAAMVRFGLLASPKPPPVGRTVRSFAHAVAFAALGTDDEGIAHDNATVPFEVSLPGDQFGLTLPLSVQGPALDEDETEKHRPMGVLASALNTGKREQEVKHYVENLARQGRIEVEKVGGSTESLLHLIQNPNHITHRLEQSEDGKSMVLRRIRIACGCGNH
jgi:hypothetical protein